MEQKKRRGRRGVTIAIAIAAVAVGVWLVVQAKGHSPKRRTWLPNSEAPLERFTAKFPRSGLVAGLVDVPLHIQKGLHEPDYRIGSAPDGGSALWRMDGQRWHALNADLSTRTEILVPEGRTPLGWLTAASGEVLRIDDGRPESPGLTAVRADGSAAWSWAYPSQAPGFGALDVLYDLRGAMGLALSFGGDVGLLAVDLQGQQLWHIPKQYVVYEVATHRDLPGYLLVVGGDALLLGASATRASPSVLLGSTGIHGRYYADTYITHGLLFPDDSGRPALLLTGRSGKSAPALVRSDEAGGEVWRAVLPSDAGAVALIEPPDSPRLFVVATNGGELLVVGDEGTLYWSERFPVADYSETYIYEMSAGELSPGAWGVCVELLEQQLLFRLHPERIKQR